MPPKYLKISLKRANSVAWLEILQAAENCGPYLLYVFWKNLEK